MLAVALLAGCATTSSSVSDVELAQEAKQGNGKAQYELAKRMAAQSDYPHAMHWMQQAASQSGPLAADNKVRGAAALQVGHWYQLGLFCRSEHQGKLASDCLD